MSTDIGDASKLATRMLDDAGLKQYLAAFCQKGHRMSANWFSRTETSLLYRAVRLCDVVISAQTLPLAAGVAKLDVELYRECALNLLPLLSPDREVAIRHILRSVVYNPNFYRFVRR